MSTETFNAKHIETRENSVRDEFLGKKVFLPRSQIERMSIEGDCIEVTIPFWLYRKSFENE